MTTQPFDLHNHPEPIQPRLRVQDWLRVVVLLGLGLYFAYNILSGNLTNYINERFAWLSYIASGIYLLLGFYSLYGLLRGEPTGSACAHDHDHHDHDHDHGGHSHSHTTWFALVVVSLPLVLGTLIPSRPLGAEAINGNLSISAASTANAATVTTPPEKRDILEWLRAFNTAGDFSEIDGQPADVIGFVYHEPTFADQQFMVARFTISCCVADASAIGLPVAWPESADLPADTWVRVQGRFQTGDFRGDTVPVLHAEQIDVIEQPEHPYLYP